MTLLCVGYAGVPGRIHVSETTHALLLHEQWEPTGGVEVKGKGQMQTFLWLPPAKEQSSKDKLSLPSSSLPCVLLNQAHSSLKGFRTPVLAVHPHK